MSTEGVRSHGSSVPKSLITDNQELPLQVGAKRLHVSKEVVLRRALESLSLDMHECKTCVVGNNQILGSVCIDVPAHGEFSMLYQKKLYGDYKLTDEDALESAMLAALLFLQKIGVLVVDDINLSEVTRCETELAECRWKLLAASNWANMFQQETVSLKCKLATAREENKKLAAIAKPSTVKKEVLVQQPIVIKKEESTPQVFNTTTKVTPPPSFDKRCHVSLHCKKEKAAHCSGAKRKLFTTPSIDTFDSQNIGDPRKKN